MVQNGGKVSAEVLFGCGRCFNGCHRYIVGIMFAPGHFSVGTPFTARFALVGLHRIPVQGTEGAQALSSLNLSECRSSG